MRLLDLQLIAYGPFTDLELDLGRREPGLHLVFGPNEAGKSAALRALNALLYGIPARTTDDFVHEMPSLRIGARIRGSSGAELAFVRRKGQKNTLLNPDGGAAYPDDVLDSFLGGVDADTFARVYGIGHEKLVEGGKELQRMRGLAGESLFAASMGGIALTDALGALRQEATSLHSQHGGAIRALLKAYKAARTEQEAASRSARDWETLCGELTEVQAGRAELVRQLEAARTEHGRVDRCLRAMALVHERRFLQAELAAFEGGRVLPASYSAQERRDASRLVALGPEALRKRLELDGLRGQISGIAIPEVLLHQQQVIDPLRARLGAHLKAAQDLSKLRGTRESLQAEALATLAELQPGADWTAVETLRLTPDRRVRIQNLAAQEKNVRERPAALARSEAEAGELVAELEREHAALGAPRDAGPLGRALRVVRKRGDLEKQRADAERELVDRSDQAARALQRMGLPTATIGEVDALPVPSSHTLEKFTSAFDSQGEEGRRLEDDSKKLEEQAERCAREITALRRTGDIPSESSLVEARSARDAGWALVRAKWLEGREEPEAIRRFAGELHLADAYEDRVREADGVADRLRREAERVAELAGLMAAQEECVRKRERIAEQKADLARRRDALAAEWCAAWAPIGVAPLTPKEMRGWLGQHEKIVLGAEEVRKRARGLEELDRRIASDRAELVSHLAALEEPQPAADESLATMIERCESAVDRIEGTARRRVELGKEIRKMQGEREAAARERALAEAALARWRDEWLDAIAAIGCASDATGPEANARLVRLDDLLGEARQVRDLDRRIEGMQNDARELERTVSGLAETVAPDLVGRGPEEAIGELVGRLDKAREDRLLLKALVKDEKRLAEEVALAEDSLARARATLDGLCRLAGVERDDQLEEAERLSDEISTRQKRIAAIDESLRQLAGEQPVEDFMAADADADALGARKVALEDEIGAREQERSKLDERIGEVRTRMESFDGSGRAAEADEKALGILAQIRASTERYVLLRVAGAFLDRQIERHRAATQDPILTRAGQLFAALTCRAFEGLRIEHDDEDQPVVVGVRAGGGPLVTVKSMSDGTADQLYLSLRLAYLERQLEHREPLPIVLDDILVNFDDARAQATLRVLGDLACRTQVLLFTHHERNIDLASAAVPANVLAVHRLAGLATRS